MADTIPLTFRIDADLKRKLDAAASADFRSTASLLNSIIARHLGGSGQVVPLWSAQLSEATAQAPAEARVIYKKPVGRPIKYNNNEGPPIEPFITWLAQRGDPDTMTPDEIIDDLYSRNPSPRGSLLAAARQLLVGVGYTQWVAHYPDGSEREEWRKTPISV